MNVFTLTAAGLVALGVPLAAPWLAQEPAPSVSTTALAPAQVLDLRDAFASTTAEPAPLAVISTSPLAPASPQEPAAPARVRLLEPNATISTSAGALLAPQDEAARQIAELQARIAALQAEVAALSAHEAHGTIVETLDAAGFDTRVYEEPRVAEELLLERAMQERSRFDRHAEGERRRAELEMERARASMEDELRRRTELEFGQRMQQFEQQHARHADAVARLEAQIAEHEAAMAGIDAEFANGELSPRRQERLEERREELEELVDEIYEEIDEQYEIFDEAQAEFDELEWSAEEEIARAWEQFDAAEGFYVDTQELEELGYISEEACEECEEDVFEEPASTSYLETAVVEQWLKQAYDAAAGEAASDWRGAGQGTVLPRPSNGDVIVNVGGGGGGGHDAQIVDLLREIRDEVRGLREDLRHLHGAPMPAAPRAPRASRSDFGYAPNSSSGPGVATGGGFGQGADPFGWPQTTAPQAEGFPAIGNVYGDAPSAPPGGDANALSSVEIHAPRVIRQPAPMIDAALRAAGPATVHVNLLVSETGAVANAAVKSSTDARFEQAALDAVTQWVFAPGSIDGQPNAMFVDVPIVFPSTGK